MFAYPQSEVLARRISSIPLVHQATSAPDAVFIPFRNRYKSLNRLLAELNWYEGPIYVLISHDTDQSRISPSLAPDVRLLHAQNSEFSTAIQSLKTMRPDNLRSTLVGWDLPLKRNLAILHSVKQRYQNVLILDDDITRLSPELLATGTIALDSVKLSGCLITGFPDTSVIGHIEMQLGEPYIPFLSGSCLFFRPHDIEGFFPLIYNEDWLFMVSACLSCSIASVGEVNQISYDPFDDDLRIPNQEFGEIIAEGIFELLARDHYSLRHDMSFWSDYVAYRKSYVAELLTQADPGIKSLVQNSLRSIEQISASDCLKFIQQWEEDSETFNRMKTYAT
jgi:hypothetical protein